MQQVTRVNGEHEVPPRHATALSASMSGSSKSRLAPSRPRDYIHGCRMPRVTGIARYAGAPARAAAGHPTLGFVSAKDEQRARRHLEERAVARQTHRRVGAREALDRGAPVVGEDEP